MSLTPRAPREKVQKEREMSCAVFLLMRKWRGTGRGKQREVMEEGGQREVRTGTGHRESELGNRAEGTLETRGGRENPAMDEAGLGGAQGG